MKVGSLIMRTKSDNPKHVGLVGIVIEEYGNPEMIGLNKTCFIVLWADGNTGTGWRHNSWGMEVLCE